MRLGQGTSIMADPNTPAYVPIGALIANGDIAQGNFTTLAGSVNAVPFEPKYLGDRGTYYYTSVTTPGVALEFDGQNINVVQSTAPTTAGISTDLAPRNVKTANSVRIARQMTIRADEVAAIRATGSAELDTVETRADRELKKLVRDIRATMEYHRVTAAFGIWLDADGTPLQNYFSLLGISQPTYDVLFGTAASSKWINICMALKNALEDVLGDLDDSGLKPVVLCGRTFFQKFITQPDVVLAYQYFQERQQTLNPMREDSRYEDFVFGGFTWRQYRGSATNTGRYVPDNEAHLIVDNVDGTYLGFFCPPRDIMDEVNKPGKPISVTVEPLGHNAGFEVRLQANPVHFMSRPGAAYKLFSSN